MKSGMKMAKVDAFNTRRLALRFMTEDEWKEFIFNVMIADEFYITFAYEKSEELLNRLRKPFYYRVIYYSIHLPDTDVMIGFVGYSTDINHIEYYIFKEYRNCGYAYEAVGALMEKLFDGSLIGKHLTEVRAWTVWENKASAKLLIKLGFRFTGYSILEDGTVEKNFRYTIELEEDAA